MTAYEIPLSSDSQRFTITLAGVVYSMALTWRSGTGWVLDIADATSLPLVSGIPLVTGVDLLGQYSYLGIGGRLIVLVDGDIAAVPDYDGLGTEGKLYFVTE
ncbi:MULTISPECIES: hypothetical protein [unclassified Achromobacter]|uniref:phage baseplate plug family protein n=1 Tax=unclassified Achromobacter TaxID=2626865 RepID=UPI000B51670F|nr:MULTISPECIES: hypothetical protein [unclassified Achromobacter]OWT69207.1 hypothetical protein CEY05_28690 [Achromobacter sp. HZ34]OWT70612.1 hypothetical protein CEY04_27520 [Achromobacter sp. HZ28]